ncbi:hypothetical protein MtrunA17_Chr1g0169991 [Medicago truncatula]|uniref:Cohesin subunit SA-3 n=1 Tax=Medicago truncatula TaxID=3880 RepID=A0A396JKK9_MEDTR|nr:hypothetical protein MtrunA17_Chr1g0169991 [Medicago truncatula]
MVELLTMLFEVCGAKFHDKRVLMHEINVNDVVVALVNYAKKSGEVECYQNSIKSEFKSLKENLESFLDNLVRECQHGPFFDKVLFEKCMKYIIALSCTPPRVYRQVASLMGLSLITSYITIANMLGVQRDITRRQLDGQKKKKTEGPRMETLNIKLSDMHEKITSLEEMMGKIFTGLFVHRYRNLDPNIRMSCIESLGVWILSYPSIFLKDVYLKYLGWTLNDKYAGVRKSSIRALQNLYEMDDNVPSLGLFTERYSGRMIDLADDIDVAVAVQAIGLVKQLIRHQLITGDELGNLYNLLTDDPPEIRHAIGALVYDYLIAKKFNSSESESRGENDNSSKVHLERMLRILDEFPPNPILTSCMIDDVWDYMEAMKDWKCIISMLLDENSLITNESKTNLVRLLCASVKKAVGEKIVPAIDNRKQYYNKTQKEVFENNKHDITIAMMESFPLLLQKFISDEAKVSLLVEIVLYMNLEFYSLKRQEQNFKNLLQLMKNAFFKHGDKDPLRGCVKAINFCCVESRGELQDVARNNLKEVEDLVIDKLESAIREVKAGGDEYSLLVNLRRLYELQLSKYVPIDKLYEDIVMVLRDVRNMKDEVVGLLLQNLYFDLAWSLKFVIDGESVSDASVKTLLSKRDTFLQELDYFVNLVTDSNEGDKSGSELDGRGYQPNADVLQKFSKLCQQQLNVSDEVEDDDVNKEETNRCAVLVGACKLIYTDVVPKDYLAPEIISHFVMHGTGVAAIVKNLITFLKKRKNDLAAIFLEALKKAYHRHTVDNSGNDDMSSENSFSECKNLAVQISRTYIGAARNKYKSDILKLVNGGIEYAFEDAPKHLSFLEAAVIHFVSKLPASDVLEIKKDVEKRTENVNKDENPSGWRPYYTFVEVLQEKGAKNEVFQVKKEGVSVKRQGRPQGKKLSYDHSSSEDEDSISTSEQEEDDEDVPLTHSIRRSSKLRPLGGKRIKIRHTGSF